jgi:hypothetical protein
MSAILSLQNLQTIIKKGLIDSISYFDGPLGTTTRVEQYKLLVCDEPAVNAFKYYELYLTTKGDVVAKYARIGRNATTYLYPNAGERFFRQQTSKKLAKGYKEMSLPDYQNKVGFIHNNQ